MNVLETKNLCFNYGKQPALKNVNITLQETDFMAVVGPNGGGKTTLLKLILGLLVPSSGSISLFGKSPKKAAKHVGYVPQYGEYDKNFPVTVLDVILMASISANSFLFNYKNTAKQKAMQVLKQLKVDDIYKKSFNTLSGGQKQRVLIARALMFEPKILLLDEPTASVDSAVEKDIYQLLKELKLPIILVTHDIGVVSKMVNKVTCLNVNSVSHNACELIKEDMLKAYSGEFKLINHTCGL